MMEAPQPCRPQAFPPLGDDEVKLNATEKIGLRCTAENENELKSNDA